MARAVFTRGSPLRHIIVMTSASTVGLLTLFSVDLVDMYFLSLLGQQELAAAIGFAGTLLFFLTAMSVGLQIAMGALVARAEGAHDRIRAGAYCTNVMVFSTLFSVMVCLPTGYYLEELLIFLGARGETLELATAYARILLPGTPLLVVGMGAAAALRALGDAKRSMYCTLGGAFANAVLDPIFIFGFGWGIEGAALASLAARTTLFLIACFGLFRVHRLPARFGRQAFFRDMAAILPIAGPALLTNLATPIGSSYVLKTMSEFGDSAVAGAAILGRIAPVAFAAVFSLSGSVGPIVGQNAGAGLYQRVRQTLLSAMLLNAVYTLAVWLLLYLMSDWIIAVFDAQGDAAVLIGFYTHYLVGGFMFVGMLFIANTAFNNLHRAYLATVFNFARMLLGTVPLVYLFSRWGPPGVMAGELGGAVLFGSMAFGVALWQVKLIERSYLQRQAPGAPGAAHDDSAQWAFSSQQAQLGQKCTRPQALE